MDMLSSTNTELLKAVPFTHVSLDDCFWAPRQRINTERTLAYEYTQCQRTGRIDAFKLQWQPGAEPVPHFFWDSDVAKWIEAASYSLATHPDPVLDARLDEVIALIAAAQMPDGYLNTYFSTVEPGKRWTDLRDTHELYCAGHLIEAAVAHFRATGKRTLLDVLCRYADHIATVFGTGPDQKRGYCGHEEIELALVKLYHATGERRYLDLSAYFVNERGRSPNFFVLERQERGTPGHFEDFMQQVGEEYNQSHRPVREQDRVGGHAVRAMYLYSAMADLAHELGDTTLKATCERLWAHLCEKNLYVTGGIGPSRQNEGFTGDYDLPNETAYAESCAAIGLVLWAQRMLHLDCDGRYADVMERTLYNGVLSGISLDGEKFFYDNPLASSGHTHRQEWFDCACCPPNIARVLASLGNYVYSQRSHEIAVHLYIQGRATFDLGEQQVVLRQRTQYPWKGRVIIQVDLNQPQEFRLKLRHPGWCRKFTLSINGQEETPRQERGYLILDRKWQTGDAIELDLSMPVERVYAHPLVKADRGRAALQRGPLVYCLEAADNGNNLDMLQLPPDASFVTTFDEKLLGGTIVIRTQLQRLATADWQRDLYRSTPPATTAVQARAIPYCLWDNREAGEMLVWLRRA
jgi:DUF1680 family protein